MLTSISIIVCSVIAGVLYRCGGSGNYPRQVRTIGVPLLTSLCTLFFVPWCWWTYLIAFGLCIAAISTYFDFLFEDTDCFWMHGLMIGMSALPLCIVNGHWGGLWVRAAFLAIFMGLWSLIWDKDVVEEVGRGASIVASLPLLLL